MLYGSEGREPSKGGNMAYRAFIFVPGGNGGATQVPVNVGTYTYDFESLEKAKKGTQAHLTTNKAAFGNGYDAYILDTEAKQVVSFATVPQPTLDWKDSGK
jgi:hypothetical protein